MDHNDRMIRDLAREQAERAQIKANAGRTARLSAVLVVVATVAPIFAGTIPPLSVVAAAAVVWAVLMLIGVKW
jgi:hypothetical protein